MNRAFMFVSFPDPAETPWRPGKGNGPPLNGEIGANLTPAPRIG
jgi:hypothetical protein